MVASVTPKSLSKGLSAVSVGIGLVAPMLIGFGLAAAGVTAAATLPGIAAISLGLTVCCFAASIISSLFCFHNRIPDFFRGMAGGALISFGLSGTIGAIQAIPPAPAG
ncbi:MAG: hypothetical protein GC131_07560 [Alphaproteobacteria bacterium]|nr:hypothetical protein [Alphaproteobacteria bacterium]